LFQENCNYNKYHDHIYNRTFIAASCYMLEQSWIFYAIINKLHTYSLGVWWKTYHHCLIVIAIYTSTAPVQYNSFCSSENPW